MIGLLVYVVPLAAAVGVSIFLARVLVIVLDPVIGYRPEKENARNPPHWPDDPHMKRPPIAVGPGRPVRATRRRVISRR